MLGEHLPRRVVMLAVEFPKQSNRELQGATKADGRCSVAIGTFGSNLFVGVEKNLQRMFVGQTPRM